MERRTFMALISGGLFAAPLVVEAQQTGKVWRVGYLSAATAEFDEGWVVAFRRGLREAGYVEGKDIVVEQRHAAGRLDRIPELATELVRLKVDVLVVYAGAGGVQAAKKVTGTIPIVMTTSADPVGTGLVASLARPGGNVTGLADAHGDLVSKRLGLLKEIAPPVSRVAVLSSPTNPGAPMQLKNLHAAAPRLGVTLFSVELGGFGPDSIDRAFSAIGQGHADALFIIPDPTIGARYRQIADLAVKSRLPAIATVREWAFAGGLLSYGTNFADLWRRAATYVDRILKGAKPADLPVEQPTKFELVINLKTAKALGLTIPPSVLARADEVIQ